MEKKYSISDASRQVEVENHVLRYWEEELGLNIHRNSKGHRFYTDRDIKVLRDVKDLKEHGFLLKAIKLIVHDIDNIRKMNPNELYKLREELNQKVQDEEENVPQKNANDNVVVAINPSAVKTVRTNATHEISADSEEKIRKFEMFLRKMITKVVEEGQKESEERISENVSTKLMKELNYIMMQKDEVSVQQTKLLEEILDKLKKQGVEEVAATCQIKQIKTKEKPDKKNKEKNKTKRGLRIFG